LAIAFDRPENGGKIKCVMEFRWNSANIEHIALHDLTPEEAEYVVRHR